MLKEHLKKHFKRIQTIKLKRHHYILGGFGIAAIILFASIFGFQKIGTHAETTYTIKCNRENEETPLTGLYNTGDIDLICEGENLYTALKILNSNLPKCITISGSSITGSIDGAITNGNGYTFEYRGIEYGTSNYIIGCSFAEGASNDIYYFEERTSNDIVVKPEKPQCEFTNETDYTIMTDHTGKIVINCNGDLLNLTGTNPVNLLTQTQDIIAIINTETGTLQNGYKFTYTYQGHHNGQTNITFKTGSVYNLGGENDSITTQINVTNIPVINCTWGTPNPNHAIGVNDAGTITLNCSGNANLTTGNIRQYVTLSGNSITGNEVTYDTRTQNFTFYYTGNNPGFTKYVINGGNEDFTIGYSFSEDIEVRGNKIDCIVTATPTTVKVGNGGTIEVSCDGNLIENTPSLQKTGLEISNGNIINIVTESAEGNYNGTRTIYIFGYKGNSRGVTTVNLTGGVISNGIGRNLETSEGPEIIVYEETNCVRGNVYNENPISVGQNGYVELICTGAIQRSGENTDYNGLRDIIKIENTPSTSAVLQTGEIVLTGHDSGEGTGRHIFNVHYQGATEGTASFRDFDGIITGDDGKSYIYFKNDTNRVDVTVNRGKPYCTITGDTPVHKGLTGAISVSCTGLNLHPNFSITEDSLIFSGDIIKILDEGTEINSSTYTASFVFEGQKTGHTELGLTGGIVSNSTQSSEPTEFEQGIDIIDKDQITCSRYTGYTLNIGETRHIRLECTGTNDTGHNYVPTIDYDIIKNYIHLSGSSITGNELIENHGYHIINYTGIAGGISNYYISGDTDTQIFSSPISQDIRVRGQTGLCTIAAEPSRVAAGKTGQIVVRCQGSGEITSDNLETIANANGLNHTNLIQISDSPTHEDEKYIFNYTGLEAGYVAKITLQSGVITYDEIWTNQEAHIEDGIIIYNETNCTWGNVHQTNPINVNSTGYIELICNGTVDWTYNNKTGLYNELWNIIELRDDPADSVLQRGNIELIGNPRTTQNTFKVNYTGLEPGMGQFTISGTMGSINSGQIDFKDDGWSTGIYVRYAKPTCEITGDNEVYIESTGQFTVTCTGYGEPLEGTIDSGNLRYNDGIIRIIEEETGTESATFIYLGRHTGTTQLILDEGVISSNGEYNEETTFSGGITVKDKEDINCIWTGATTPINIGETGNIQLECTGDINNVLNTGTIRNYVSLSGNSIVTGNEIEITRTETNGAVNFSFPYSGNHGGISNFILVGGETENSIISRSVSQDIRVISQGELVCSLQAEPAHLKPENGGIITVNCPNNGNYTPLRLSSGDLIIDTDNIITISDTSDGINNGIYTFHYTGNTLGNVNVKMRSGAVTKDGIYTSAETDPINIKVRYDTNCVRGEEQSINQGEAGYITLTCDGPLGTGDSGNEPNTNNLRRIINATNQGIIETGNITISGEYNSNGTNTLKIYYTGTTQGTTKLHIDGTLDEFYYITDNEESEGKVTVLGDKPECNIRAEPDIIPKGQSGTIKIKCGGTDLGVIRNDEIDYSGDIINIRENEVTAQVNETDSVYTFHYTGEHSGRSQLGLKTGAVENGTVQNDYAESNTGIYVLENSNIECTRTGLTTNVVEIGETGAIKLECNMPNTIHQRPDQIILGLIETVNEPGKVSFTTGNRLSENIIFEGEEIGHTHFYLSGNINEYITVQAGESEEIKVYQNGGIQTGCIWLEPYPNPIGRGQGASIKLKCDELALTSETPNEIRDIIEFNNDPINGTIINTGGVTIDSVNHTIEFSYTGNQTGVVKLFASGNYGGMYIMSESESSGIIVRENSTPYCTISGTEMVISGNTGTITVQCNDSNGIETNHLNSGDLIYNEIDRNIISVGNATVTNYTETSKTFTFTFTGINVGESNLALRTGVIRNGIGQTSNYTEGNNIKVVTGENGIHYCHWKTPEPNPIVRNETGSMKLDCLALSGHTPGDFVEQSGNSVTWTLNQVENEQYYSLDYTGTTTGTTYFAISGVIGNVQIQTDPYRSSGITVIGDNLNLILDPERSGWTNQNIVVHMTGENATNVRYYVTGADNITIDQCLNSGTPLNQNGSLFTRTTTISQEGITYIHLCGEGANNTRDKIVGTYKIDKTAPYCMIVHDNAIYLNNIMIGGGTYSGDATNNLSYYRGTNNNYNSVLYINTNSTGLWTGKNINASGTYYLFIKDEAGNITGCNKTFVAYQVKTMLDEINGTTGNYTTNNYSLDHTSPTATTYYYNISGNNLNLQNLCTSLNSNRNVPSTLKATTIGEPSTVAATPINSVNASNTTYACWYDRDTYQLELVAGIGISSVNGAGTYKYGKQVSISAIPENGYTFSNWTTNSGNSPASSNSANTTVTISGYTKLTANSTDNSSPTVTLTSNGSGLCTTGNTYTVTGTFSEPVTGVETGDLHVENGTIQSFNIVSNTIAVWTVKTSQTAGTGGTNVQILPHKFTDIAGNGNTEYSNMIRREYDFSGPTFTVDQVIVPECTTGTAIVTGVTQIGCSSGILYSWNGGSYGNNTTYSIYSNTTGTQSITIKAKDNLGNETNNQVSFTWTDSTLSAHDFIVTGIGNHPKTVNRKTLSEAAAGICETISGSINNNSYQGTHGTCTINGEQITYTPNTNDQYSGNDKCFMDITDGDTTINIQIIWQGVDTNQLTCTITQESCTSGDVLLTLTANKPIHTPEGRTQGINNQTYTKTVDDNGNIMAEIQDLNGNIGSCYTNVTNHDNDGPSFTFSDETVNECTTGRLKITNVAQIGCSLPHSSPYSFNGNSWGTTTTRTFSTGTTQPGNGTKTAYVRDALGNQTRHTATRTVNNVTPTANDFTTGNIGNTGKDITLQQFLNASYASEGNCGNGDLSFSGVKTNGTKGTCSINDNTLTYTPNNNTTGSDTCTITIKDNENSIVNVSITFTDIDTIRPIVELTGNGGQCVPGNTYTVTGTFNEEVIGITQNILTVTNGQIEDFTGSNTIGVWKIKINTGGMGTATARIHANQAHDHAGNGNIESNIQVWEYDNIGPAGSINVTYNGNETHASGTELNLSLTANDQGCSTNNGEITMQFSCNNEDWSNAENFTSTKNFELSNYSNEGCTTNDGTKTIYVKYIDSIGNESEVYYDSIVLDTIAPELSITTTHTLKQTSQRMTGTCENATKYYIGNTPTPTYTNINIDQEYSSGIQIENAGTYYVFCQDDAGNTASGNKTYYNYTIYNLLEKTGGNSGIHNTNNFDITSSGTYLGPKGLQLVLSRIYTIPTGANSNTFIGSSNGEPSTNNTNVNNNNPTLNGNSTYSMWFARRKFSLILEKGTGIDTVIGNGQYKYGETVNIDATVKTGFTWKDWTIGTSSATIYSTQKATSITITGNTTLKANAQDNTSPICNIVTTSNPSTTTQTATLSGTDGVGITKYYWGTNNNPGNNDYVEITSNTNFTTTKTVDTQGTYYLFCKDAEDNISEVKSIKYVKYQVKNMIDTVNGTTGNYTTTNYDTDSTKPAENGYYIIPHGTNLELQGLCTAPIEIPSTLKATSIGQPSLTPAENIVLANADDTTYTCWFDRVVYQLILSGNTGIESVSGEGTYKYGKDVSITATAESGYNFHYRQVETGSNPENPYNGNTNITIRQYTKLIAHASDSSKPSCSRGNPSNANLKGGTTGSIELICTDNEGIDTNILTGGDIDYSETLITLSNATVSGTPTNKVFKFTYTGNENINGSTKLRLKENRVKDNDGNSSATVESKAIKVDNIKPYCTINTQPTNNMIRSGQGGQIAFTCISTGSKINTTNLLANAIQYSENIVNLSDATVNNTGNGKVYTFTYTAKADGETTFKLKENKVSDEAGNTNTETAESNDVTVDMTAPTCDITGNPTNRQNTGAVLTLTMIDTHVNNNGYKRDNGEMGSTKTIYVTANGTHTGYVRDLAGNEGSCSTGVTKIDTSEVTTEITAPDPEIYQTTNFNVSISDTGGISGLSGCYYYIKNGETTGNLKSRNCDDEILINITNECNIQGEDTCTVYAYARNNAGTTGNTDIRSFNIDTSAESANVGMPEIYNGNHYDNGVKEYFKGVIDIRAQITGANTCEYLINNNSRISGTKSGNYCLATNINISRNITIRFRITTIGGTTQTGNTKTFYLDNTPPELSGKTTYNSIKDKRYNKNQESIFIYNDTGVGISGKNQATCRIDNEGTGKTCSVTPNICDHLGNCNNNKETSNKINLDKTEPNLKLETNMKDERYNRPQTLTFNYEDNLSGISGDNSASCYINVEGTGLTCEITPKICDKAGNCNTKKVTSQEIKIDMTGPECGERIYNPTSSTRTTGSVETILQGSYDNLSQIHPAHSGGSCTITVPNDNCEITIKDNAGNTKLCTSNTISWIDRSGPITGTIRINDGAPSTSSPEVTLTLSAQDEGGIGMGRMRFSCNPEDENTRSEWEVYNNTKEWNLITGSGCYSSTGNKTVYVQYVDNLRNNIENPLQVSDDIIYSTDRPSCTISGTILVMSGNNGTITVRCNDANTINTTQITSGSIIYNGEIITIGDSNIINNNSKEKVFTLTFTGIHEGVSNLALKTGAVTNGVNGNNFTQGNEINVINENGNGNETECTRGEPSETVITRHGTGIMTLYCPSLQNTNITAEYINNIIDKSGESVEGKFTNKFGEEYKLAYTGENIGTTRFAVSGTIGNVHISTNQYRSSGITVILNNNIELQLNPQESGWTNTGIEVQMIGENTTWLKYTTGNNLNSLTYNACNNGINIEGNEGTTIISEEGTTYIYLCGGSSKDKTGNKIGTYRIDTNAPTFEITGETMINECETGTAEIRNASGGLSGLPTNAYNWNGTYGESQTFNVYSETTGSQNIIGKIKDNAGNESQEQSITFTRTDKQLTTETGLINLGIMTGTQIRDNVINDFEASAGSCENITINVSDSSNATCTTSGYRLTINPTRNYNGEGSCTIEFSDGDTTKTGKYEFTINTINGEAPELLLTLSPEGSNNWIENYINVTMSANNASGAKYIMTGDDTDIELEQCRNSGTDVTPSNIQNKYEETISINTTGINYIYLCGKSLTGRLEIISGTYKIDITQPNGSGEYVNGNGEYSNSCATGNVIVRLITGESLSGYPEKAFARNSTGDDAWTGNNTLILTENGSGFGYIRNNAGKTLEIPYDITGIVSTGPTAPTLENPNNNTIQNTNTDFTWSPSTANNCATIREYTMYILSGTNIIRSGTTVGTSINPGNLELPNGTYSRYVIVTDNFDQTAQSEIGQFTIDSTAITVRATPNNNNRKTGDIYITMYVTGTDIQSAKYIIESDINSFDNCWNSGTEYSNGSGFTWSTEGISYLTLCAQNSQGKTGYRTGIYKLDNTAPICGTWTYNPPLSTRTNSGVVATLNGSYDTGSQIDPQYSGGSHTITNAGYVYSKTIRDNAGNTKSCPTDPITNIDKTAPECTITTSEPANGIVTLTLVFSGEDHPNNSGYSWNGNTYNSENTKPVTANGTYTGYVKDLAGNIGICTKDINTIDTSAPQVSATNNSTSRKTGDINITMHVIGINLLGSKYIMENSIKSFNDCWTNGTEYTDGSGFTWTTEGTRYLTLCAKNTQGKTGYRTGIYKLDKTAPECGTSWTYSPAQNEGITNQNVTGTLTRGDPISGPSTHNDSCTVYSSGNDCTVTISDSAGNSTGCNSDIVTRIDKTKPNGDIIIEYPDGKLNNGCTNGNVKLTLTGSDANGLATQPYKWNNDGWTSNPVKTLTANESGTGYIKDAAGNIKEIPYNITGISKSGPAVTLNRPNSGVILTGGVITFSWNANINSECQSITKYELIIYSGTNEIKKISLGATSKNISGLPNGSYRWKVKATDILLHETESEVRPFTINSNAPTCLIDYRPGSGTRTSGDVVATLTGCTPGTTGFNETGHTFTGNGTFKFTFKNEYNITGNAIADVRWIDKDAPVIDEVTPIDTTTDTTPDYTFSSTESGTIIYSGACSSNDTEARSGNNTVTFKKLSVGTYDNCTITVVDKAGNPSNVLHVSDFKIKSKGSDDRDYCPDGDYSDSYYDGTCNGSHYSDETRNFCKVDESSYDDEMKLAYIYSYTHGMTTMCPIGNANLYGTLRRDHLAKILSQYAMNVLGLKPEIGKAGCDSYNDIAHESDEMKYFMKTACELGLMGLKSDGDTPMESFYPHGKVTRGEFGTTLSRLIYGDKYNLDSEAQNTYPGAWYSRHLAALKRDGIMTQIDGSRPQHFELRGYVMLMVMRHGKARIENVKDTSIDLNTDEEILSMYNKNKELTCDISYFDTYQDYGSGVLYIQNNKLREDLKTTKDGSNSAIIKNNKIYVRGDSTSKRKGFTMEYDISAKEELQDLLDDDNYDLRNCKGRINDDEVFDLPDNITFISMDDRFDIFGEDFDI